MCEIVHCFVSRDDWSEWRRINPDIPPGRDYDAFLKDLRKFCDHVAVKGGRAVKINVNPSDFLAWCRSTGRDINANARADYAAIRFIELNNGADG